MKYIIGVDIGGTNIDAGIISDDGENCRIIEKSSIKTAAPRSAQSICEDIDAMCRSLAKNIGAEWDEIGTIGVGCPGIIKDGTVVFAGNLQFENVPLSAMLSAITGKTVTLCNDGNAAAYGEYYCGAGRGSRSVIAVTLGTGVGGGIICDGKCFDGFSNTGCEIGHIIIEKGGRLCSCGNRGCFEAYCSATALIIDTIAAMQMNKLSKMWEVCGGNIADVSGKTAFSAARAGDKVAQAVVDEYIGHLADGVYNLITLFHPEKVCIGGGIANEGDALFLPLREQIHAMSITSDDTEVVLSELGSSAGIMGAAIYSKHHGG